MTSTFNSAVPPSPLPDISQLQREKPNSNDYFCMLFSAYGNCCCVALQYWGFCPILPILHRQQQENFLLIYSSNSLSDVRILELPVI